MNYFSPKQTAERYEKGRPYFHENTIQNVKEYLGIETKLSKVLDIACGTGLSTKALLKIAKNINATDTSIEMLTYAFQNEKIIYSIAKAEKQPFSDNEFDMITVCSGVHWFEIDDFLMEANRLLKSNSWLILYDNFFISEMQDVPEFSNWFSEVYLKRFPSPKRNNDYEWTDENLKPKNFSLLNVDNFKNSIRFTKNELILYFTTQSNITAQIENGILTYEAVEKWLDKELNPFFGVETRTINFGNWIKYIQKTN